MDDVMKNLSRVSARLSEETFLTNKGLSNEVGIHVFCYDPKDELTVRAYFETLKNKTDVPYHLIECDLYKIFLQICEEKHILKSIPKRLSPTRDRSRVSSAFTEYLVGKQLCHPHIIHTIDWFVCNISVSHH